MGCKITHIGRGKYMVGNVLIEYANNMRYDISDGKYHPGWMVHLKDGGGPVYTIDKDHAIQIAKLYQ